MFSKVFDLTANALDALPNSVVIPEPGTGVLMLTGMLALATWRGRFMRRRGSGRRHALRGRSENPA